MPYDMPTVQVKLDLEVVWGELPTIPTILQHKFVCLSYEPVSIGTFSERRDGYSTIDENERGLILKAAVLSPLHSNELGREDSETHLSIHNNSTGICNGVVLLGKGGRRRFGEGEHKDDGQRANEIAMADRQRSSFD
jgi:hypothetical protein